MLGHIFQINIGEVHIIELHASQLLQLFFNAPAHFQRNLQDLFQLLFCIFAVRIHELHKTAHHLPDRNRISLIQVPSQTEILIQSIPVLLFSQFPQKLSQIIRDETIIICKMLRPKLRNLPTRNITMYTIQKRCIRSHLRRKRIKQTGSFQQNIHTLINISHKDHRCGGRLLFFASGKGSGRHIILHDLDPVFILKMNTGHLIKSNDIPHTDKANCLPSHVIEKVGHCGLSAGYQNTVRRYFLIQMGLTCGSRTQFTQIEVILYQRNHT